MARDLESSAIILSLQRAVTGLKDLAGLEASAAEHLRILFPEMVRSFLVLAADLDAVGGSRHLWLASDGTTAIEELARHTESTQVGFV